MASIPVAKENTEPPASESDFEFADINALMCLLCARQFKSVEQLKRHNKESDLHKAGLLTDFVWQIAYHNHRKTTGMLI